MNVADRSIARWFMVKSFLILALVTAQLGAVSGAPLYLCLAEDGSLCIDGGPATCDCCKLAETEDDCCPGDHSHRHEADGSSAWQADPCGCTHVQISHTQAPVTPGSVSAKSGAELAALD